MTRSLTLVFCLVLSGVISSLCTAANRPTLAVSINGSNLPGSFKDVEPMGFDLSPDGKQIAIAFRTGEYGKEVGVWLSIWDITTKQLLSSKQIDTGLTINEAVNPHAGRDVRYTPDGRIILVQTGPKVLVLQSLGLKQLRSIEPTKLDSEPKYGPSIAAFDVSSDGLWLAILTRSVGLSEPVAGLRLVDLQGVGADVEWLVHQNPNSIAISSDGSRIVLSGWNGGTDSLADVALLDSRTGKVVGSFRSGCPDLAICGASDAQFWGRDKVVTTAKPATDATGKFLTAGLRIFDIDTGRLIRTLEPKRFSSIGKIFIAHDAPALTTVNVWETRGEVTRELDFRQSKPEVILFNLANGSAMTVLRPISRGQQFRANQYCLRLSADASMIALFEGSNVEVFRLAATSRSISGL